MFLKIRNLIASIFLALALMIGYAFVFPSYSPDDKSQKNDSSDDKYQKNLEIIKHREANEAYLALPAEQRTKIEADSKAAEQLAAELAAEKEKAACFNHQNISGGNGINDIYIQVVNDSIDQYRITKQSGSAVDICVHAGLVGASFLQAKNNTCYAEWKGRENNDCANAGI